MGPIDFRPIVTLAIIGLVSFPFLLWKIGEIIYYLATHLKWVQ
jgi:hypothetical protein